MRSMTRVEAIPYDAMRDGHAVGLGDVPRVPRLDRPHAEGGQHPAVRAGRAAARRGCSAWRRPRRACCRPTTSTARSPGCCTRRWTPAAAAGRRSACHRRGPAAVQRDWDGTPMPTDVMHDETCRVLAARAGRAQPGRHADDAHHRRRPQRDMAHLEELATISGRPLLHNVVQAFEDQPARPPQAAGVAAALPRAGHPGLRPGRHHRRRLHVHVRGLEPLRRLRGVVRGHHRHAARSGCASWPTRPAARPSRTTCRTWPAPPLETVTVLTPKSPATEPYRQMSVGQVAEAMGKHLVDAMLDIAVADGLRDGVLRRVDRRRRRT